MANYIIADNQELTSYALESLLSREPNNQIRHASCKAELFELLKHQENSIVFLDYTLFDFTDEENLLIVSERFSMVTWVLISDELSDKFLRKILFSSHQFSVVFKSASLKSIRETINYVRRGERYICQQATEVLLQQQLDDNQPMALTATELEIMRSIAQGKTTKEIAAERFSSIHTINTHRKNIFRKLGVNTAHEAVKYAFRAGLVDPSEFYI